MRQAVQSWDSLKAKSLAPVGQVVNKKEKFLKKIKNSILVNTWAIRKWNSLIANMDKVLVVQIEDQTSHNISLGQILSSALVPLIMWRLTEVQRL